MLISLVAVLTVSVSGFHAAIGHPCQPSRADTTRSRPALLTESSDQKPKITIRAPNKAASVGAAAAAVSEGGTKVTVRVRSPSESASPAVASVAPDDVDDDMVVSSVTVKAPARAASPPPAPSTGPKLTASETLLLEATQKANCSQVLEALQLGANPNVRDPKGRTPLHFVAGVGLAPAAVLLIHFGAQLDARDEDGLTPLHMAAGYANAQTLRVLVSAGADPELAGAQGTPAEVVSKLGDYQLQVVWRERKDIKKRFNKKDEKLERLKACMDVLVQPESIRETAVWDDILLDAMKAIGGPNDSNVL